MCFASSAKRTFHVPTDPVDSMISKSISSPSFTETLRGRHNHHQGMWGHISWTKKLGQRQLETQLSKLSLCRWVWMILEGCSAQITNFGQGLHFRWLKYSRGQTGLVSRCSQTAFIMTLAHAVSGGEKYQSNESSYSVLFWKLRCN